MRILPILFNTEMVKAILDGRKDTTRRILKLPKYIKKQEDGLYTLFAEGDCYENQYLEEIVAYIKLPYRPEDVLYVRETWSEWTDGYIYKAWNEPFPQAGYYPGTKWRPSIHMPKEAARIFLKVTDVIIERLQNITGNEVLKEGLNSHVHPKADYFNMNQREMFENLWNSTIKKENLDRYGWDANPWVWVIEFERCEKPEGWCV